MESLRDIGYDLPAAVADLVDNSLDADATSIEVDLVHDRDGGWVRVADDGCGMTERALDEAMRYGSSRAYRGSDLGHFGLGLKTASLSQARRLTVATRSTFSGPVRIRRWDLDLVAEIDDWQLERLTSARAPAHLVEPLRDRTGTVVLWEHLDRLHTTRRHDGEAAANRLAIAAREIADHLSMVFHRFLQGEADGESLELFVNGQPARPWDPFARDEPHTQVLTEQHLALEHYGVQHTVVVRPHILPAQQLFSSPEAHDRAGGPNRWNRQQGLYIYRRDRLIQSGGWNRLRTLDEHAKLARIALDAPPGADGAFRTNVAKMNVGLPDGLRPDLRALVAGVVSRAQSSYRHRLRAVPAPETPEEPTGRTVTIGDQWPQISQVLEHHLADQPELLDRILIALANVRPAESTPPAVALG